MGENKALLKLADKTLYQHAADILKAGCNEILLSSNIDIISPYRVVKDEINDIGPAGGIVSCLNQSETELNFVLSCDMPLVPFGVFQKLLHKMDEKTLISVPTIDGHSLEPLCAIYRKSALPSIMQEVNNKNYTLYKIIKILKGKIIDMSEYTDYFINVNTPDDLEKIKQRINS